MLSYLFSWRNCSKLCLRSLFPFFFSSGREARFSVLVQIVLLGFWTLKSIEIQSTWCVCVCVCERESVCVLLLFSACPMFPKPICQWISLPFQHGRVNSISFFPLPDYLAVLWLVTGPQFTAGESPGTLMGGWPATGACLSYVFLESLGARLVVFSLSIYVRAWEGQRQLRSDVRSVFAKGVPGHWHSRQK
jgi:hypothetical protein